METNILCPWDSPTFFFFSENVPSLLFYSHLTAVIAVIFFSFFLLANIKANIAAKTLLFMFCLFIFWTIIDNVIWATNKPDLVLFLWSMQVLIEPMIYTFAFYSLYTFIYKKFPSFGINLLLNLPLLPLILLTPSYLNLTGINIYDCNADEGILALYYTYLLEAFYLLCIISISLINIFTNKIIIERKKVLYFGFGLIIYLIAFTSGNIIGSSTGDWDLAQYGLFGMPIFVGFLAYMTVQFKIYNLIIIGSQALIGSLWILIGSLLFIQQSSLAVTVAGFTLLTSVVLGYILVKNVKQTVKQKEQIEQLAVGLEQANARLQELDKQKSEFVSIASHQLRSPLTAIRGYAAMLKDGSYGTMPEKASEPLDRIHESAKLMASSIEDFLSVSRIESGNMKYELADFNLREQAEHIVDDLRAEALKVGLVLLYKSDLTSQGFVNADIGKTQQILHNLINNSLKYTPKGTVTVFVHEDLKLKKLYVEIIDTGIGMSKETINTLFAKFTRAKNANSVNIKGTGLGLFVAREMARAMNGEITAHSAGDGMGSHFVLELPLVR